MTEIPNLPVSFNPSDTAKPVGKGNDTTLTPLWLIEQLGPFDFDPCAYRGHPTAKTMNVWPSDGLLVAWNGFIWCNPPYSNPGPWLEKMAGHGNGVALVLASTDTRWFQSAFKTCSLSFFPKGRPEFLRKDGSPVKLMRASAFLAWGYIGYNRLRSLKMEGFYAMP